MKQSGNKLSERNQYLHYTSSHPEHTKNICRLQTSYQTESNLLRRKSDLVKHICEMKSWFSQRGYQQKFFETHFSKAKFSGEFSIEKKFKKVFR